MYKILHTKHKRNIAYQYNKGESSIGIIFLSGFKSDMYGSKAQYIFNWCKKNDIECTIFDYSGHGNSSEKFINCNLNTWIEDSIDVINNITSNPQIIIGSSMGAWIAIRVTQFMPKNILGLITIAAAPDFTEEIYKHILNKEQKKQLNKNGFLKIQSEYDKEGYLITKELIHSGNENLILNDSLYSIKCPIRLIHGKNDQDVSWKKSVQIFEKIKSQNAELILIKDGDHRLSNDNNLIAIINSVKSFISILNQ